jgi:hypothetical protein
VLAHGSGYVILNGEESRFSAVEFSVSRLKGVRPSDIIRSETNFDEMFSEFREKRKARDIVRQVLFVRVRRF